MTLSKTHWRCPPHFSSRTFLRPDVLKRYPSVRNGSNGALFLPDKQKVASLNPARLSREKSQRHKSFLASTVTDRYWLSFHGSPEYSAATKNMRLRQTTGTMWRLYGASFDYTRVGSAVKGAKGINEMSTTTRLLRRSWLGLDWRRSRAWKCTSCHKNVRLARMPGGSVTSFGCALPFDSLRTSIDIVEGYHRSLFSPCVRVTRMEKSTDWRLRATSPHAKLVPRAWIRCKLVPGSLWKVFVLMQRMEYGVPCQRTVLSRRLGSNSKWNDSCSPVTRLRDDLSRCNVPNSQDE